MDMDMNKNHWDFHKIFENVTGVKVTLNESIQDRKFDKIITHDGMFHADELLGVSLIQRYVSSSIPVERKRMISEEEFSNPNIIILDVGKKYEPELGNLDHHHDPSLGAACILVYDWIEKYLKKSVGNTKLYEFLNQVSMIDTGKIGGGGSPDFFNAKVKVLNNSEYGFNGCLQFSSLVIDNLLRGGQWSDGQEVQKYILAANEIDKKEMIQSEMLWNDPNIFKKEGNIAYLIDPNSKVFVKWQQFEMNKPNPIIYTMTGKNNNGGYSVMSLDSNKYPIEPNENQTFLHNAKFFAIYNTVENAINHMREMGSKH